MFQTSVILAGLIALTALTNVVQAKPETNRQKIQPQRDMKSFFKNNLKLFFTKKLIKRGNTFYIKLRKKKTLSIDRMKELEELIRQSGYQVIHCLDQVPDVHNVKVYKLHSAFCFNVPLNPEQERSSLVTVMGDCWHKIGSSKASKKGRKRP